MDHNRELEALYALDFGEPTELGFRILGSLLGAAMIHAYAGWWTAWIWASVFAVWIGLYWLAMRHWTGRANARVIALLHISFLLMIAWYVWIPVRMIASNDTALTLAGAAVFGCVYFFMLRQVDYAFRLIIGQIAVMAIATGIGLAILAVSLQSPLVQIGLALAWVTMHVYFVQVMLIIRKDRQRAQLAAERSAQARKMEALGQMAGGVAHDFNNILAAAMGNLELAKIVEDEAERNECLDQAHASLGRAAGVIRDLLQFARPRSEVATPRSSPDLLAKINTICSHALPSSITISVDDVSRDLWVQVEEDQFMTAMMNLVINASHAIDGSGRIELGAEPFQPVRVETDIGGHVIAPGRYVAFTVTDSGPGVADEIVNQIAHPFFTTKPDGQGTGLGLPMVHAFSVRAGGGLMLTSRPGRTRFSLILPRHPDPFEANKDRAPLAQPRSVQG